MAWGYEKSFTIEHDETLKTKICCKDCIYYDKSDKSCTKRPLYLPVDGYSSWRNCDFFELNTSCSNYEKKYEQLNRTKRNSNKQSKPILVKKKSDNNKCHIGMKITHKKFGVGRITKIKDEYIYVVFNKDQSIERQLNMEYCLEKGFIKIDHV